jgi:hypothetical protein
LDAIWTDERLSAVCNTMRNTDHIRENADAARRFKSLKEADIHQLRDATLAHAPMREVIGTAVAYWPPAPEPSWAISHGFERTASTTGTVAKPAGSTPNFPPSPRLVRR